MAEETARISQIWPAQLKDAVNAVTDPPKRTLTDFTIEAVREKLGYDLDLQGARKDLNETRYFAQLLADRMVMGGEHEDRLQALMEVEFPPWVDTTGWPEPMAQMVRRPEPEPEPEPQGKTLRQIRAGAFAKLKEQREAAEAAGAESAPPVQTSVEERVPAPLPETEPAPKTPAFDLPHDPQGTDLFSRVMNAKNGPLADVPNLTTASNLKPPPERKPPPVDPMPATPEPDAVSEEKRLAAEESAARDRDPVVDPMPASNRCPTCQDELIDGECWTCG